MAYYSDDEQYRYLLHIVWDIGLTGMSVIGLNPSTATELVDDPTLRRVKWFARHWGFGSVLMFNAFALRSTDPKKLFKHPDPVGPENTVDFILKLAPSLTVAAWGTTIQSRKWAHYYRGHDIDEAIPNLHCFQKTASGHPAHPLYLKADLQPQLFSYKAD